MSYSTDLPTSSEAHSPEALVTFVQSVLPLIDFVSGTID